MIKVTVPLNNSAERKYVIDIMCNEFLGLEYQIIESEDCKHWEIELNNGSILIFEDHFFNNFTKELSYLQYENIPSSVEFISNRFIVENDIPILFGNSNLWVQTNTITCGIDIFASSFFMLTRWEEYVNKKRDKHDRFPGVESLAFKNFFLDRPIVNEYLEMFWNMLKFLGIDEVRKNRTFQIYLTHDIDVHLQYPKIWSGIKEIVYEIIIKKAPLKAVSLMINKLKVHFNIEKDPFDTFEYLMGLGDKYKIKNYFFFMGTGTSKYDNYYSLKDNFIKKLAQKIKQDGHYIGIHPTYNAYRNFEQFCNEKREIEENLDVNVTFGREHYLRFEIPETWQIWENNKMEWDSSLSYADKEGFRCGVCYDFSVFNILTMQKLNLKENPLIVMEASFVSYQQHVSSEEMLRKIMFLMSTVQRYNGNFVILWHNSSFNTQEWKPFDHILSIVMEKIK